MIEKLPSLAKLVRHLQRVPYLASKNLHRVATHFLNLDEAGIEQFCKVLTEAKKNIVRCDCCCSWREVSVACPFCESPTRRNEVVCVVETWQELVAIERTGGYQGSYHVLGGAISPLDGIGPEDLTVDRLVKRVAEGSVAEVILAINQTPEGDATAVYIANKLVPLGIKVSCLARGLPVGSSLEFMDRVTVYKALSERRPF